MAYRDPYNNQYGQQQAQYNDGPDFNPYTSNQQQIPAYDLSGPADGPYNVHYGSDAYANPRGPPARKPTAISYRDDRDDFPVSKEATSFPSGGQKESDTASGFDNGEFGPQSHKDFKSYRASYRESLWTKGGRGRCVGRFCCCGLMTLVYLLVSIILALLLWVRPPAISIQDAGAMPGQQLVQPTNDGIDVRLGVNLTVANPNYFSLNFREIKAEIFYPINNTPIGGGTAKNVMFKSQATTNWTFPFSINYKTADDPRGQILSDLVSKCGPSKSEITVNYKLTLGITILMIPLSPVVSDSFRFTCPLDISDLGGLTGVRG